MLLTIIIPVYNIEKYIHRCLNACLNQDFPLSEYEIICVNDGSTDNSLEILREYEKKYSNIKIIDKENGGVSSARNTGIEVANGQYIWFVDGDDWINVGVLPLINRLIQLSPKDPDGVLFPAKLVSDYEISPVKDTECEYEFTLNGVLKNQYANSVWFRWFKRKFIIENSLYFDTTMKYGEDTLFIAKYRMCCKELLVINKPIVYYYFQNSNSAMGKLNASEHCKCMLKLAVAYKQMSETCDDDDRHRLSNAHIRAMQACCRDLCLYCNDYNFVKNIIKLLKLNKLYPFGIDYGNFRIDLKQSRKNDILNWMFGLISIEPYFWLCWHMCHKFITKKNPSTNAFELSDFQNIIGRVL